jgi:hypothetical protein
MSDESLSESERLSAKEIRRRIFALLRARDVHLAHGDVTTGNQCTSEISRLEKQLQGGEHE